MHSQTSLLPCALALLLTACEQTPACPDCDAGPVSDLPCGGADLYYDDRNCGACGNDCYVERAGTEYEAGNCSEGVCGPRWYSEQFNSTGINDPGEVVSCDDICVKNHKSCVTRGCSGKTGYVCVIHGFAGIDCELQDPDAWYPIDWEGECSDDVVWPEFEVSDIPLLSCCCE